MAGRHIFKRGLKADLPVLVQGEPAFSTDTKELFVGASAGNVGFWGDSTNGSRSFVQATHIVAQSIAANTATKINFSSENIDQLNEYDGTGKFTAQKSGIYLAIVSLSIGGLTNTVNCTLSAYLNGASAKAFNHSYPGSTSAVFATLTGSLLLVMNAGHYLEVYLTLSTALGTDPNSTYSYLQIIRVA